MELYTCTLFTDILATHLSDRWSSVTIKNVMDVPNLHFQSNCDDVVER